MSKDLIDILENMTREEIDTLVSRGVDLEALKLLGPTTVGGAIIAAKGIELVDLLEQIYDDVKIEDIPEVEPTPAPTSGGLVNFPTGDIGSMPVDQPGPQDSIDDPAHLPNENRNADHIDINEEKVPAPDQPPLPAPVGLTIVDIVKHIGSELLSGLSDKQQGHFTRMVVSSITHNNREAIQDAINKANESGKQGTKLLFDAIQNIRDSSPGTIDDIRRAVRMMTGDSSSSEDISDVEEAAVEMPVGFPQALEDEIENGDQGGEVDRILDQGISRYIRENPTAATAVAGGVGTAGFIEIARWLWNNYKKLRDLIPAPTGDVEKPVGPGDAVVDTDDDDETPVKPPAPETPVGVPDETESPDDMDLRPTFFVGSSTLVAQNNFNPDHIPLNFRTIDVTNPIVRSQLMNEALRYSGKMWLPQMPPAWYGQPNVPPSTPVMNVRSETNYNQVQTQKVRDEVEKPVVPNANEAFGVNLRDITLDDWLLSQVRRC